MGLGDGGGFATLVLDDDMMGEGEHELDFSSHPDSDTSDEDEEHYRGAGTDEAQGGNNSDEEGEDGQCARGRYQLLIPFQVEREDGNMSDSEDDENQVSTSRVLELPPNSAPGSESATASTQIQVTFTATPP